MKDSKPWKVAAALGKLFIGVSLMTMTMMVFINAVARYGFSYNFPVFEELSRYLFVWVAFLGAMLGYSEGKHVGVDMVVSRFYGTNRFIISMIAEIAVLGAVGILLHGAWGYFTLTYADPSPSSGIPYGMISGMAIVLAVYCIGITFRDMARLFKAWKNGDLDKKEAEA